MKFRMTLAALALPALLAACGGGGSSAPVAPPAPPPAPTFSVSGTVTGLVGGSVVTMNNGNDQLTLNADGTFVFGKPIALNGSYSVAITAQPIGSTCSLAAGTGSGAGVVANVSNVAIVCSTNSFPISGSVSGLAAGHSLTMLDNGGDAVTVSANGAFAFAMPIAYGGSYAVSFQSQPTGQTCSASGQTGSSAGINGAVSNVAIVCSATTYAIGGSVAGMGSADQVTLMDNGTDSAIVKANGSFAFANPIPYNGSYAVTIGTQPRGSTCSVSGGTGSGSGVVANVSNVAIACSANTYSIGGSVAGLAAGQNVTLLDNAGDPLTLSANGAFTFAAPIAYGGSYAVTVGTQPAGQTCTASSASGAGVNAIVGSVAVTCSTNTYPIGGSISGLSAGDQVTLNDNGADPLTLTANGAFTFATPVAYNGSYAVTVSTQPVGKTCTVSAGAGSPVTAGVSTVSVSCSVNTYTIGGTLTGLAAGQTVTLYDNGGDALTLSANGPFTFATSVVYGGSYAATISTLPVGEPCSLTSASGSPVNANVSSIALACRVPAVSTAYSSTVGPIYNIALLGNALYFSDNNHVSSGLYSVSGGTATAAVGPSASQLFWGLAGSSNGSLYGFEAYTGQMFSVAPGASSISTLGSAGSIPTAMAADASGNVYYTDASAGTLNLFHGGVSTVVASGLSNPQGVAVDSAGNVFFTQAGLGAVIRMDGSTHALSVYATGFSAPYGVAVDAQGNVYVADNAAGTVTLIANVSKSRATIASSLASPTYLAVDSTGVVYEMDSAQLTIHSIF